MKVGNDAPLYNVAEKVNELTGEIALLVKGGIMNARIGFPTMYA
jgi:hypothetical protein